MNVFLSNDYGCYFLTPVNKRLAKQLEDATGNDSVIFQTDWDFPGLARTMGWNGKVGRERCQHRSTDGTVTCTECGKTAGDFIAAATEWLDDHCNQVFRGKGEEYFNF